MENTLKLSYSRVCTKKEFLFTHHFVAFYSHSQIILTIWNYSGCHLCHVLFLDSINNPGTVVISHRTVEMTIFQ